MLSLLLLSALASAEASKITIHNADEFIDFGNRVREETDFKGTTVLLDADIDFAGKTLRPIGTQEHDFRGIFDGQGHAIKNLLMNSTDDEYVGLFGRIDSATVKNVILDSTCAIISHNVWNAGVRIGALVGGASPSEREVLIQNVVNRASVSFTGHRPQGYVSIGGLVGTLFGKAAAQVVNSVNYGTVSCAGAVDRVYVGGLIGTTDGNETRPLAVVNSANYGKVHIAAVPVTSFYAIGGLIGDSAGTAVTNCVSYGEVAPEAAEKFKCYRGSVAGSSARTAFAHSFWSDRIPYEICDEPARAEIAECSKFDDELELNASVTVKGYAGTSLPDALNAYAAFYTLREYNEWLANRAEKAATFVINGDYRFTARDPVVLPPHFLNEGKSWFQAWFLDDRYTMPLKEAEIRDDVTLYGRFANNTMKYKVTFDAPGAVPQPRAIEETYGKVVMLPDEIVKDTSFTVEHWETAYGDEVDWAFSIPAHDVTLRPVWIRNRITDVRDFIEFAQNVSAGVDYRGMTIVLGEDLDFAATPIEPVGRNAPGAGHFRGTFDGKGHAIKNLAIHSYADDLGLFGYTQGMTLRNLVLDASCSFKSANATNDIYLGSFIGRCEGACKIENCENRAPVTYATDNKPSSVYVGGLAGSIGGHSYIDKCANRGAVTHNGDSYTSYLGGFVGLSHGDFIYVENSDNYGTITHRGTAERDADVDPYVGLPSRDLHVNNCNNHGKIDSSASGIAVSAFFLFVLAFFFF